MTDHSAVVANFEVELQKVQDLVEQVWQVASHGHPVPSSEATADALAAMEVVCGDLLPQLRDPEVL